jgi:hypothetical protein
MNLEALRDALGEKMAELVTERAALRELFADEADAENRGPEAMKTTRVWSAA